MRDNEQRSLGRLDVGRDFMSARQQQLPRNYGLGEITFAEKIRDDENLVNRFIRKKKSRVAQARFLFPKGALDIGKNVPALNFARVSPSRRARIRIHG